MRWGILENRKAGMLIAAAVAVVLRFIYLVEISSAPFFKNLFSDSSIFDKWAMTMVNSGDWFSGEPFFMAPLYPYFLGVLYRVFGHSIPLVHVIQSLIGIGSVLLVYLIGERLFKRPAAFIAALLTAAYPVLIYFENLVLVETLQVFLSLLMVYLLLRAVGRPSAKYFWLAAGVVAGLSALARPNVLLVALCVLLWILIELHRSPKAERYHAALLFTFGAALVIAPVTLRNAIAGRDFVLISSNGGLNFFIGNNPDAPGVYYNSSGFDLDSDPSGRNFAERETGRLLKPSGVSSYWMGKGLEFVRSDPGGFLALLLRKASLFFSMNEIPQVGTSYQFYRANYAPLLKLPLPDFLIVSLLGFLGIYFAVGRHSNGLRLLLWIGGGFILSIIVIFVSDRFRLPVVPFLALLGAFAVTEIVERVRRRDFPFAMPAVIILAGGILLEVFIPPQQKDDFALEYQYLGNLYYDAGQFREAAAAYRRSLDYHDNYFTRNNFGNTLAQLGDVKTAVAEYVQAMKLNPRHPLANFNLGNLFIQVGEYDRARRSFERSINIDPRFAPAYRNLAILESEHGEVEAALRHFTTLLSLVSDPEVRKSVEADITRLKSLPSTAPSK